MLSNSPNVTLWPLVVCFGLIVACGAARPAPGDDSNPTSSTNNSTTVRSEGCVVGVSMC